MDDFSHERRTWMPAYALTIQITTTLLLGIRLVTRFQRTGGKLGLDDLCITIGWAIATANIALIILFSYKYGLDRHISDVPPNLWKNAVQMGWLSAALFLWSTAFTKVSVLLFYRRLVAGTYSKRFKWAVWSAIAFIITYTSILFILLLATCVPLESYWRRLEPTYTHDYHCASTSLQGGVSKLGGALSVITDFYSVLLPAILLLRIQITRRQRIGLVFIFGLGFLVVIAGIVRTIYLAQLQSSNLDKTWLSFNVLAAGIAEGNIGIICACAPSLKSCFRSFFRDHISTMRSKTAGSTGNSGSRSNTLAKGSDLGTWEGDDKTMELSLSQNKKGTAGHYEHGLEIIPTPGRKESKDSVGALITPPSRYETIGGRGDNDDIRSEPQSFLDTNSDEEYDGRDPPLVPKTSKLEKSVR